jgi:preprotein translocase subunit SecG
MKVLIIVIAFFFISFLLFSFLGTYARNTMEKSSVTPTPTTEVTNSSTTEQ